METRRAEIFKWRFRIFIGVSIVLLINWIYTAFIMLITPTYYYIPPLYSLKYLFGAAIFFICFRILRKKNPKLNIFSNHRERILLQGYWYFCFLPILLVFQPIISIIKTYQEFSRIPSILLIILMILSGIYYFLPLIKVDPSFSQKKTPSKYFSVISPFKITFLSVVFAFLLISPLYMSFFTYPRAFEIEEHLYYETKEEFALIDRAFTYDLSDTNFNYATPNDFIELTLPQRLLERFPDLRGDTGEGYRKYARISYANILECRPTNDEFYDLTPIIQDESTRNLDSLFITKDRFSTELEVFTCNPVMQNLRDQCEREGQSVNITGSFTLCSANIKLDMNSAVLYLSLSCLFSDSGEILIFHAYISGYS